MEKQLNLFDTINEAQQPACFLGAFSCIKDWVTPDGRIAFIAGKTYKKARTHDLSIVGENYILIFIREPKLSEHFC
jgi:hypothetical protein